MIIATRPLIDCCPIVPAAMEGRQIVQWDKDSCSDAGFLKIDLLGLGMLSAVERTVELIARTRGERIDLSRIPYDDPATYECIQEADTTGVFQIESRAQMASLRRTRPENLRDITIQVAIVRPGPIQGGAVNPYIARRQRMRVDPDFKVPYDHPSLEPVLEETLGTIIFQDQVLEVSIAFAGFGVGEAEGLRRAMSRKRSEAAIEAYHERFVEGAQRKHGVEDEIAERVWEMVKGFSGFGFPKAHGAAFGLLAYQSTWLRVHYHPGVPVRAAQRAADGLLSAGRARARGAAAGDRGPAARRQRERGGVRDRARQHAPRPRGPDRAGLCPRGPRPGRRGPGRRPRSPAGASAGSRTSPRAPAAAPPRWSCWPGRARATRWPWRRVTGGACARDSLAGWRCGSWG